MTRSYIVSVLNDYKDENEARDKLLKNAIDLGASVQPYYGYWARAILTGPLKNGVTLTGEVTNAAEIGNKKDLDWAKKKWYMNAFVVAGILAMAHSQTKNNLIDMLYKHLDLAWGEIQSILKNDATKDLEYYEKDRVHMLMFSDVLSDGVVKQFPEKFKD